MFCAKGSCQNVKSFSTNVKKSKSLNEKFFGSFLYRLDDPDVLPLTKKLAIRLLGFLFLLLYLQLFTILFVPYYCFNIIILCHIKFQDECIFG